MNNKLSDSVGTAIGVWLFDHRLISEQNIDVIRYAFEYLVSEFGGTALTILLSFQLKQFPSTLIYLLTFMLVRKKYPGYHCSTMLGCFLLSSCLWLIAIYYPIYIHVTQTELVLISLCLTLIISVKQFKTFLCIALLFFAAYQLSLLAVMDLAIVEAMVLSNINKHRKLI